MLITKRTIFIHLFHTDIRKFPDWFPFTHNSVHEVRPSDFRLIYEPK